MQIRIDISSRTEVAAAIPLLQLILGHTFTTNGDGPVSVVDESLRVPAHVAAAVLANPAGAVQALTDAVNPAVFAANPAALPVGAEAPMNPAIFGAGAAPLGMPALPGAGAIPQMNAPVGMPGSLPPMPGVLPNAALPGNPAGVPVGNATLPGTPAAGPATGVDLDAEGIPWDERIHAGTKTKTKPGLWKAKKGVNDEALVNSIKAELKARAAGGVPAPVAAAAPAQQPQGGPAALPPLGAGPFVPPGAVSQPAQTVAPSAPVGPPTTFEQFMPRITAACTSGVLPMEAVQAAVTAYQLPSITALQQNPTYVPHVWAYLQQQYPALA